MLTIPARTTRTAPGQECNLGYRLFTTLFAPVHQTRLSRFDDLLTLFFAHIVSLTHLDCLFLPMVYYMCAARKCLGRV